MVLSCGGSFYVSHRWVISCNFTVCLSDISGKELFLRDASMMDSDVQFLKQGMFLTITGLFTLTY